MNSYCDWVRGNFDSFLLTVKLGFSNTPTYVKAACRKYLSKFGTMADLERLEQEYAAAQGDLEQIEILCALKRMESGRRNSFLARHAKDGEMHKRAVKMLTGKI